MNASIFTGLRALVEEFVTAEAKQRGAEGWWQAPLVASAPIDQRFDQLPQIAADDHWHPHDLLPTARSVLVYYIPFQRRIVTENRPGSRPCRKWVWAYVHTNNLLDRLSKALEEFLADRGFQSGLTPVTHNFNEKKLMARWSHKHIGYLANLGRFGTHHMLITPAGCTGRMGSLVTEAELGDNALIDTEEACLLKVGRKCGKCIEACPVEALHEESFERRRCWNRLRENRERMVDYADLPESTSVCGKCAAVMPCSFLNPVARLE